MNSIPVPEGTVPVMLRLDLSEIERMEVELHENIRRVDLTWQERADATSKLMKLRSLQAEITGAPPPTVAQIAEEVRGRSDGSFQDDTRKELIVAQHLSDPEVRKAKSVQDAFKVLRRKEEAQRNVDAAGALGVEFVAAQHELFNTETTAWLSTCEAERFDIILTDPPYGINAQDFGTSGGRIIQDHQYDDSPETWHKAMPGWCQQFFRVAKKEAHAYVFCDIDNFGALKQYMATAGWWVHRTPLIVYKRDGARVPWPEHGPQRKWELCLYAVKGKLTVTRIYGDVIECISDDSLGHGAQKPVSLYVDLLKRSARPGMRVLDVFCGTGTIFPACTETKCFATGVEGNPQWYAVAAKRISSSAPEPTQGADVSVMLSNFRRQV